MGKLFTNLKKRVAILTVLCMVLTLAPSPAFAATASDISGHWAEGTIQSWVDNGLIKGYPDGTFKPDNNITRAEFITLVNRAFEYTKTAPISFTDVNQNAWYASAIGVAVEAGYISGYPDGTMKPENPISREEAATIIMRIKNLVANPAAVSVYTDASSITWGKGEVGAVTAAKIMQGYPDGSFMPRGLITRAETVIALDNAMHYTVPADDVIPPVVDGGGGGGSHSHDIAVSAITVTPTAMTLAVGVTGTAIATVSPTNATNQTVTWSSDDEAVATVVGGVVTPLTTGTAIITVTTVDGSKTATCTVTVVTVIDANLTAAKAAEAALTSTDYTDYSEVTAALEMAEGTDAEKIDKTTAINDAIAGLVLKLAAYNAALAAVTETDYTADSWTTYAGIVTGNVVTTANTQEEIDAATLAITTAQGDLEAVPGDLELYMAALAAVTEADYTVGSWTTYAGIVTANVVTIDNLQSEVDAATLAITTAQGDLEAIADVDTTTYAAIVLTVPANNDLGTYTAGSWTAFETAIAGCDLTLEAADGQAALDAEVTTIQEALDLLEAIADVDTTTYAAIVLTVPANNDLGTYTAGSWTAFETAIAGCDLTLEAADGQAALDAEVTTIQEALDLLEAIADVLAVGTAAATEAETTITYTLTTGTFNFSTPGIAIDNWTLAGDNVADLGAITEVVLSAGDTVATITVSGAVGAVGQDYTVAPEQAAFDAGFTAPAAATVTITAAPTANIILALTSPTGEGNAIGFEPEKRVVVSVANGTTSVEITGTLVEGQTAVVSDWGESTDSLNVTPNNSDPLAPIYTVNTVTPGGDVSTGGDKAFKLTVSEAGHSDIVYRIQVWVKYPAPVTGITVTSAGEATTITVDGGTLQMSAAVLPVEATVQTVTWSVVAGTGTASIDASGLLTALTDGTVTVKATANDGSPVQGTKEITISNQV